MKLLSAILLSLLIHLGAIAQSPLPVLKANNPVLSIRDGKQFKKDEWTVSAEIPLDVYTADKAREGKTVSYISDLDSISFELERGESKDFWVVLNGKDSCLQRLESGLLPLPDPGSQLVSDTIPFVLTPYNNIAIQVLINGLDTLDLMFHTAASSVGLTNAAVENMKSIQAGQVIEGASGWGGEGEMRFSKGNRIEIGGMSWDNQVMLQSEHSGHGTDGKFGPNLFENKVLEVDYEGQRMVVHSRLPQLEPGYVQHELLFQGDMMFLKGNLDLGERDGLEVEMLIHSGYSGTLLLDDEFVDRHKVGEKLTTISEGELSDSFGNKLKTKKATLPELKIGANAFSDMPVGFFEGAIGRQKMSVIGGELLKRFDLILDLQNGVVYLRPNGLAPIAFTDR